MVLRFTLLFIRSNRIKFQKKTLPSDRVFFLFYFSRTKKIAFILFSYPRLIAWYEKFQYFCGSNKINK